MPLRRWIDSTNNAIEGILYAAKTQKHLRYHFYVATIVLILSYILGVESKDFLFITFAIILVLLAEMFNTALEYIIDILSPEYTIKARIVKDVAAGTVLITAFGAVVIGYIILSPYVTRAFTTGLAVAKYSKGEIALIATTLVLILVIILKTYLGRGHPLRGGMPSGHAAIAFSIWVTITYITENFVASLLTFIMAVAISQSRIGVKAHRPIEVILGALMGAGVTFLLFKIFY